MCDGNCAECKNRDHEPERRKFLGLAVGAINVVLGGAILGPVLGFIGSPLRQKSQKNWVAVLGAHELTEGETREASFKLSVQDGYMISQRKYTVFLRKKDGEITCFDPACTHLGCRIKHQAENNRYVCPCHGGMFDEEGNVISGPPPKGLDQHPVRVADGKIWVYKEA